jgi:hypothetical protein
MLLFALFALFGGELMHGADLTRSFGGPDLILN